MRAPHFASGLLAFVLLSACASTPDYRAATGPSSAGYSETRIESDRYLVSYRLKSADQGKARSMALRRAAELTLSSGYDTFEIVTTDTDSDTERERDVFPTGPDRRIERSCGLLGCTTRSNQAYDPFPSDTVRERNSVSVSFEIVMSDRDANVSPSLYDASEVYATLSD